MPLETATYISDLNPAWPLGGDKKSNGDNHLQMIKGALKATFPNVTGAVTPTHVELNFLTGVTSSVQTQLNTKAPTANPIFTGSAGLPAVTTIGAVTASELSFLSGVSSAIQTQINGKGSITGEVWMGAHNFTGATVTVPTAATGDASATAASTAFVAATSFAAALPGQAGNAGKFVTTNGSAPSWEYVPFASLTGKPTTVAGYGIADAATLTGAQTLENKIIKGVQEAGISGYTASGGAYTVNLANGSLFTLALNANCTFTFPTADFGRQFTLVIYQNASFTLSLPAGVLLDTGTVITAPTTGKRLTLSFVGDGTNWLCYVGGKGH